MLRIRRAVALPGFVVRLTLTDGATVERDIGGLLVGPVFEPIRRDPTVFRSVRVHHGTLAWPGDVDLDPDVLIWCGTPPRSGARPPSTLVVGPLR